MSASVVQNSALVLSLWHCKVAWFCTDSKNKYTRRLLDSARRNRVMESIYKGMKPLRSAIHGLGDDSNDQPVDIPEMAQHFNDIVSKVGIPKEVWAEELHSLMDEIVSTNRVLKDFQQRRQRNDSRLKHDFDLDHIHRQPSYTTCLLTLWYWLAVWCSPDDDQHSNHIASNAKHEFMLGIERYNLVLAKCLVNPSSHINHKDQRQLQNLFSSLMNMLTLDLQHWIDALDHFTDKMVNAGILRGQVKKVLRAAGALNDDSTAQFSRTVTPRASTSAPQAITAAPSDDSGSQHKFLLKKGGLSDQVFDTVIREPVNQVLDKLEIMIVSTIEGITKEVEDHIIDRIPEVVEEVGHKVVEVAKKIGQGVEHVVAQLHPEVVNLGHKIGEGMHRFAEGAKTVFHKIGHIFKSIF